MPLFKKKDPPYEAKYFGGSMDDMLAVAEWCNGSIRVTPPRAGDEKRTFLELPKGRLANEDQWVLHLQGNDYVAYWPEDFAERYEDYE